jgi:tetratricopeptide (TPR) repeat protein
VIEILLEAERNLSFGRLDQAERLYRQAADADPRNSIAVVGLGRVAIERGDEGTALDMAERALVIDPENDVARRMAERLREVRQHRDDRAAASGMPPAGPDVQPARQPDPERQAEPGPQRQPQPEPQPEPGPAAEAEPHPEPEPGPATEAESQPRQRGGILAFLRRLFRLGR